MSKILIEGNKVIIDGHASDLETCNTLTNLCDELSKSEKFRTVKYESGYGEFESVSENDEKKFDDPEPIIGYKVNIQSNDGTTTLAQNATVDSVVVTSTGAQLKSGSTVNATYTYSGSKLFVGLATSANATAPKYKPGDTIEITAETTLYIVENIIIPEHHSSLTELFTNIAAVIREKTGDTASIIADDFPSVIRERLQVMLISFKIDGKSYQAEEGMTWGEWINSAYNTSGFKRAGNINYASCGEATPNIDSVATASSRANSGDVLYHIAAEGTPNASIVTTLVSHTIINNMNYKLSYYAD